MPHSNSSRSSRSRAAAAPRSADDESRLVALASAGNRGAFDELVRRHAEGLYAVVVRLCASGQEAEEVTQEAFLRAWRGLPAFRGGSQFFAWLYRIGVNEARRRSQRSRRGALVLRDVEGLSTAQAAAVLGVREAAFKSRLHRARCALRLALADRDPGPVRS